MNIKETKEMTIEQSIISFNVIDHMCALGAQINANKVLEEIDKSLHNYAAKMLTEGIKATEFVVVEYGQTKETIFKFDYKKETLSIYETNFNVDTDYRKYYKKPIKPYISNQKPLFVFSFEEINMCLSFIGNLGIGTIIDFMPLSFYNPDFKLEAKILLIVNTLISMTDAKVYSEETIYQKPFLISEVSEIDELQKSATVRLKKVYPEFMLEWDASFSVNNE